MNNQELQVERVRELLAALTDQALKDNVDNLYEQLAEAANATETTGDDIRKFGPFLHNFMDRAFAIGFGAAIKNLPAILTALGHIKDPNQATQPVVL